MAHIIVFGDSIAYGLADENGGWVSRLREIFDKKAFESNLEDFYLIYNLGICGDTTTGLLERFDDEIERRLGEDEEIIIIFSIGVNDSEFYHPVKNFRIPEDQFKANIAELIKKAKKKTKQVFFVGLAPVDESKVDPTPWTADFSYRNEYVEKYNEIIKQECEEKGVVFIDLLSKVGESFKTHLVDGVHPSSEGHKIIFEIVKEIIEKETV